MLRDEAYVPFDIDFSEKEGTSKVITGPNMAGMCLRARVAWCKLTTQVNLPASARQ